MQWQNKDIFLFNCVFLSTDRPWQRLSCPPRSRDRLGPYLRSDRGLSLRLSEQSPSYLNRTSARHFTPGKPPQAKATVVQRITASVTNGSNHDTLLWASVLIKYVGKENCSQMAPKKSCFLLVGSKLFCWASSVFLGASPLFACWVSL